MHTFAQIARFTWLEPGIHRDETVQRSKKGGPGRATVCRGTLFPFARCRPALGASVALSAPDRSSARAHGREATAMLAAQHSRERTTEAFDALLTELFRPPTLEFDVDAFDFS